jgi:histidinol-phosphate aminotransferase
MSNRKERSPFSRRSFLQLSAVASAALAGRIVTEPMLAYAQLKSPPKGGILLNANENPLGPAAVARQAVANITTDGGRYLFS